MADQARRRGDLSTALQAAEQGIRLGRNSPDSTWSGKFHLLKAEILLSQTRTAEARPLLENPPAAVQSARLKPRLLMDQAELQNQSEHPDQARSLLAQARDLAQEAGDESLLAAIEIRRGLLLIDFDEADAAFRRALEMAIRQHDALLTANASGNLGYIRLHHFRYDEAIPWFEAADRAAQNIPSKLVHEKVLGNLGWCYFRLGQLDRARDAFTKAEALASEIGLPDDQQRWLGNIGSIYKEQDDFNKAVSYYSRAFDIAARLGNHAYVAAWLANLTDVYIIQANWDAAENLSDRALEAVKGAADSQLVEASSRLYSGLIAGARGRTKEADAQLHEAIRLAERAHQPNVSWEAHSGLAALYRGEKLLAAADQEYAAAMQVLDREWLALSRDESKITFRAYLARVYQEYVSFLSEQKRKEKALEVAESSRARLLVQKLEGRTSALPLFKAGDAVRMARQTGIVLLSYWLAPERSYLWAVGSQGILQFALPSETEIAGLVDQHKKAIENLQDPLTADNDAARKLYRLLLGPVEPLLHSAKQVLIVPDGRLHQLNFETLVVEGAHPHYWIEDATVAVVPSLSVLRTVETGQPRRPRVLIIGDPLPADPEFPPLPHLKTEIREIAAGFPEADRAVHTGAQAYAEHFRDTDPRAFTAIHFAAHATANEESPLNSAIILSPHDGRYKLYASDVAALHLDPDVVSISACRSAGSKAYSGEGLIGFAWAFLEAGAHSVVAGIWNVDDAAAPMVMEQFYKEWREGGSPPASLRNAKLKLLHSTGALRKPYYWGPFEVFTRQATRQTTRSAMDFPWRNSNR